MLFQNAIIRLSFPIILLLTISSCSEEENPAPIYEFVEYEELTSGYSIPWAVEVIGETEFLFTDRMGSLHHYKSGKSVEVENIPLSLTITADNLVFGGLMDVSLHPDFENNKLVYIAYVGSDYNLAVARFQLEDGVANAMRVLFKSNGFSIGSRIAWQDEQHFFLSIGIGGSPYPEPGPQNINDDRGKIHRLLDDGRIPDDNPVFPGQSGPSTIWSLGHRNPQGLYFDQEENVLYANEHGPLGGDELNIIEKGGNYGWPLFSHGRNYDQTLVTNATQAEASEFSILPMHAWGPDFRVAPSGLLKLKNTNFANWNGSFIMGAMLPENLLLFNPDTKLTQIVMKDVGRVRDIEALPSGDLIILIDQNSPDTRVSGRIVKLSPK